MKCIWENTYFVIEKKMAKVEDGKVSNEGRIWNILELEVENNKNIVSLNMEKGII